MSDGLEDLEPKKVFKRRKRKRRRVRNWPLELKAQIVADLPPANWAIQRESLFS